jgi:Pyruvate/2-oxoacid:ferredoxin oxidoreductase gamma subunit
MIMLGKMIKETGIVSFDNACEAMKKVVSAKHADLLEANINALKLGYNY